MFDTFHRAEFFQQRLELGIVIDHQREVAAEQTVVRVDVDGTQHQFFLFRDNTGQIVYDADVVVADYTQGNRVLRRALAAPFGFDDTVTETLAQFGSIRTVGAVNLDTAVDGDETEDGVAVDGLATACQLVVETS